VRFNFIPVEEDDHRSACADFDALDNALSSGALASAHSFVEAGIDPAFDEKSLAKYLEIGAASKEERDLWIDRWHYENDRHSNMDY
jgi:hypothetical protein